MGWRYVSFRVRHELLKRSGLLEKRFSPAPPFKQYITLAQWKSQNTSFFFYNRASLDFPRNPQPALKEAFDNIRNGKFLLFNSVLTDLGKDYDWVTNPDSGFKYDADKHWTKIADYSKEAGDIKFVWEKSRFSYLYDIIRYDYHFDADCAEMVLSDILSWVAKNPVNCGPNYRCSQEMSLRILNWTFALHYYRDSPILTEEVFGQIQYAIYWQLDHIFKNIDFSRIAVRNNHAITETLTLYLAGIFYPSFPRAAVWKRKGKEWFEQEVAYQIYNDGTFLQFSMNYQRVVVQLLTWGIALSEKNGESFNGTVYDRARKSVEFLRTCMVDENGWLPNYGANDGALFFNLGNAHFRDYRPQLQALASVIGTDLGFASVSEDINWYNVKQKNAPIWQPASGIHKFPVGGYYLVRERETLTFIKCGSYKDRPSQADNLHLDIWYKGENVLLDAGSYKYNTDTQTMRYFSGTQSHNTIMLADYDQMLKGGRFIWYYWTKCQEAVLKEEGGSFSFTGSISAFTYLQSDIIHKRTWTKKKGVPIWHVTDTVLNVPTDIPIRQFWHSPLRSKNKVLIEARDSTGAEIAPQFREGWQSSLYGQKERAEECFFVTEGNTVNTIIKVG